MSPLRLAKGRNRFHAAIGSDHGGASYIGTERSNDAKPPTVDPKRAILLHMKWGQLRFLLSANLSGFGWARAFTIMLAAAPLPSLLLARNHEVVLMSRSMAGQPAEVSLAINPAHPRNVIAVSLASGLEVRSTNFSFVSHDGGLTWSSSAAFNPEKRVQGDDSVVFNHSGQAFRSYISFLGLREETQTRSNGIFVSASSDSGQTWNTPVAVVNHQNTLTPFEDKPYLAADPLPESPHAGHLYLAWTRFDRYGSEDPEDQSHIYFSRSPDRGQSFSSPIRISDHGGDCLDSDGTVEGAVPAVGTKGQVYVVWAGPRGLVLDVSRDGGFTFGGDRVIAEMPGSWDLEIEGLGRANGLPVTGVDHSAGPYQGSLYVNWADERYGDPDSFVIHSRDEGKTWSPPQRVNDDPVSNGRAQFLTWMAVDPVDGSVNVVFLDRRGDTGTKTAVRLARSIDGGVTFVNYLIDVEPFECNPAIFFGDYIGISAYGGLVIAAFPHFRSAQQLDLSAAVFRFRPGTQGME